MTTSTTGPDQTRPPSSGWSGRSASGPRRHGADDADVAHLVCDRHDPDAVAFTFLDADLTAHDLTYGELAERSRRMATVLAEEGVERGDRVPVLMGKRPGLLVTLLAIWRLGAVHVPLFTAFATGAIQVRVKAPGPGSTSPSPTSAASSTRSRACRCSRSGPSSTRGSRRPRR